MDIGSLKKVDVPLKVKQEKRDPYFSKKKKKSKAEEKENQSQHKIDMRV